MSENIEKIPVLLKLPMTHGRASEVVHLVSKTLRDQHLRFEFPRRPHGQVRLGEEVFRRLYGHVPVCVLNGLIAQSAYRPLTMWLVEDESAIQRVTDLKGGDNDPLKCGQHTLRYMIAAMLGSREIGLVGPNGQTIMSHDNYIHAPRREEVERDLSIFSSFFE